MASPEHPPRQGLRFSLRGVLLATMFVALLLAWRATNEQKQRQIVSLQRQLGYVKQDADWTANRVDLLEPRPDAGSADRVLARSNLKNASLRGVKFIAGDSAFQRTNFNNADLREATIEGGVSAFQIATFDGALMANARFTGGSGAFQLSSFVGADLKHAVLAGGGSAFQGSSFQGANLFGARVICRGATAFQAVNIDGADFHHADLSMLDAGSLESCYFATPPRFDEKTRFPTGFDPIEAGWLNAPPPSNENSSDSAESPSFSAARDLQLVFFACRRYFSN